MTRNSLAAALAVAALALGACDERHDMVANSKICPDFKSGAKSTAVAVNLDPSAAVVDECVRRWAYTLASSQDPAATVAEATVAACTPQLARWNQQALSQRGADVEASSLTTGQLTTPLAEHSGYTAGRALFYVVQARAGRCAAPPITNGAPDGIT